jgi:FMN reductase
MSRIVVLSGNPRSGSRTSTLAIAVGTALADAQGADGREADAREADARGADDRAPAVVEVGDLGPGLLTPGDEATVAAVATVRAADVLVVATPTYKGSYTGVLKVLLDLLPAQALAGKRAVPVVTAGVAPQAAAAEALLRQLLTELGAEVAAGLPVVEADLADSAALAAKYAAAFGQTTSNV